MSQELKKTALNEAHKRAGAKMVDFSGWEMPLHYGSQVDEHHQIRNRAGMFDVSHMVVSDLAGADATNYLQKLLANDVARLKTEGKALYSCMLNEQGGVIDDLIVYWMGQDNFRIVTNAATRTNDLAWMQDKLSGFDAELTERLELSMVALQGPEARSIILQWLKDESRDTVESLDRFYAAEVEEGFIARTGYTGEDGFEVMLPHADAEPFWQAMVDAGVEPCGLGARDTLRLEAGMMLYGVDMTEKTTPLESALSWTVALDPESRDFIGRLALEQQKASGVPRKLVGLLLDGRGVMRSHQKLFVGDREVGEVTSGGFSPTLKQTIALARIESSVTGSCDVDIRGRRIPATIGKPMFVRDGKSVN